MLFEPVWISTSQHLDRFYQLYASTPMPEKALGIYNLPEGFPHVHMYWGLLPLFRVPVVMVAAGAFRVESDGIQFEAKPFRIFGSRLRNLQTDLHIHLRSDELTSIERYAAPSPVISYYNLPFTCVHSTQAGLASNFLVCAGGAGPAMGKIRATSEAIFAALQELAPKPPSGQRPT